jgi:hypothetical protein
MVDRSLALECNHGTVSYDHLRRQNMVSTT